MPGGSFGPAEEVPIGAGASMGGSTPEGVSGAVLPDGSAVVAFSTSRGEGIGDAIWWALRDPDGTWHGPFPLEPSGRGGATPDLVVDRGGGVLAVWDPSGIEAVDRHFGRRSVYRPAGGAFSAPQDVPDVGADASLAIAPSGEALFVGAHTSRSGAVTSRDYRIRAALRSRAGRWSEPFVLSGPGGTEPAGAFDERGRPTVVYRRATAHRLSHIRILSRSSGRWQPSEPVSALRVKASRPDLGFAADGTLFAAWLERVSRNAPEGLIARAVVRSPSGRLGRRIRLSGARGGPFGAPTLAVAPGGDAVATWLTWTGRNERRIDASVNAR